MNASRHARGILFPTALFVVATCTALLLPGAAAAQMPQGDDTGPEPGPLTRCDTALYPSLGWTTCELENLGVTLQNPNRHLDQTLGVVAATTRYQRDRARALRNDRERNPNPNPCTTVVLCPVDPRILDFEDRGGIVEPVLYTSRSGGTISGHVWATEDGPDQRPGVVIINGSVIGFEQIYWYAAQALAKSGFVVMTFDAQGEGNSDQFGEPPDALEAAFAGIPGVGVLAPDGVKTNGLGGNGLPFYDGGTDALNFFVSTPDDIYTPVNSRTTDTSHADKQQRRVEEGFNAAFNPLWEMLDTDRIGLAGHSYGAEAASYLGQSDNRVDAVVAWDNLCVPVQPSPNEAEAVAGARTFGADRPPGLPAIYALPPECFGAPAGPEPEITTPALGITSDYLIPGVVPYLAPPDPDYNSAASSTYSQAGVDTGSIVIRGGTHFEFNDVPALIPASLRGIDLVTWYTVAWFRKYLQDDPEADRMLLTARWRNDETAGRVNPAGDPNMFSWHFLSRLDIGLENGSRFECEDLRVGCEGQVTKANDGGRDNYSFVSAITGAPERDRPRVRALGQLLNGRQ